MIIEHNNKKWFIREDMGTGFYVENGNVFAVPLDVLLTVVSLLGHQIPLAQN